MRIRAARPRRNVQQCDQELLHSAAPVLEEHGLTESFVILLFGSPGEQLRRSSETASQAIGSVGVFAVFVFLSLFDLGFNDSSFAWSERRSGYSQGISSENRSPPHCREGRGEYSGQFNVNVNVNVNHMKC